MDTKPMHFNLSGSKDGGLSPSQILARLENGDAVEPVEATTNLAYVGDKSATPEVEDETGEDVVEERPTLTDEPEGIVLSGNEPARTVVGMPLQIGTPKSITSTSELATLNKAMSVEEGCAIVYKCLPIPNQKAADDIMVNLKLTLPQFILGILNAAYAAGNYSAPLLDPAWATPDSNYLISDVVCKECGVSFPPKYRGQLFCCNACGLTHAGREDAARREKARRERVAENVELLKRANA